MLIAAAIVFLAPFVFITLTALMTNDQALSSQLWPHPFRWHNFVDVFTKAPLWRWTLNTLDLLGPRDARARPLERAGRLRARALRWRGRDVAFMLVLVALMLPPQVSVVPLYVMWAKLHPFGHSSARSGR